MIRTAKRATTRGFRLPSNDNPLPPAPRIGDIARLKGGSIDMAVENIEAVTQQPIYTCVWQTTDGEPRAAKYLLSSLAPTEGR